jgi:hypothetical protein
MTVRLPEENFVDGDQSILKVMQESFDINAQANQSYWLEGTRDVRFKAGDQNLWNELYINYPAFQRKKFNFNRIRRIVNMICGFQRRNRKTTTVLPIEGSDELTADQFSRILNWVNSSSNFYHTISEAFEGAVTTGMNLLSVWMDYREDPINGNIKLDNLSYNGFMMDQFFRKHDLSDANFVWTRKYLSKEQTASLMPERRKEIMEMSGSRRDDKFTFEPENFNITNPNLLSYDEYWHLDYRPATLLVDSQSGETMEWKGPKESLKEFLAQFPQITSQKIQKKTVKLAVVVQNRVMFLGPNPYGIDRYPFIPVLGYFEPDVPYFEWKIQGVVRSLRDSQFLYNRRKVIELDILESQINSGMKVMEDSLVDDNDAFMSGQGRALFLKKDAPLGMDSVQPMQPPQVPPSMIQLSELLSNEINQISGVNEELLGSADDDKAGLLSMLRQGAGLTTLQTLFDNLDRSQKLLGEITMELAQANFSVGKVKRVLNEEPSEQFYNKYFQKFDAIVSEGALTETQRKASFLALMEMQKLGIAIPPDILIEKAPIPEKKDLVDAMQKQAQQAAESQKKQEELQMAQIKAQINLAEARAMADQGLGVERISRIEENKALAVERRAEAIKDLEMATLDKVKAAKELQEIDINQLQKLVTILNLLQQQDIEKSKTLGDKNESNL